MEKKVDLVEQARQLRLRFEEQAKQVAKLEKDIQHARGTARMKRPTGYENVIVKPAHGPHYVGDDGPTDELMRAVQALLMERPMTFQDILEATGARDNRVKGSITALQREGVRVVDIAPEGTRKARWFIPSDKALERLERLVRAKRPTAARK